MTSEKNKQENDKFDNLNCGDESNLSDYCSMKKKIIVKLTRTSNVSSWISSVYNDMTLGMTFYTLKRLCHKVS